MNKLKFLRESKNISVRDLAAKTNINPGTISRMENGNQQITDSYLITLADYFKVSIDYLLGRDWYDPEKTIVKVKDFDYKDILNKLENLPDKQLYNLAGVIEYILEQRDQSKDSDVISKNTNIHNEQRFK